MTMRANGRGADQLRPVQLTRRFGKHAEGSVLIECGDTHVLCTASVEDGVPHFLRGKGQGWVTAEYGMLPRATHSRSPREAARESEMVFTIVTDATAVRSVALGDSGIIAGLGERNDEVVDTMRDLRAIGVDVVTIGQYLQPSDKHVEIDRWVHPDEFDWLREQGEALGFGSVFSGPLVRSSYRADEQRAAAIS